jgi:hypothetical protein
MNIREYVRSRRRRKARERYLRDKAVRDAAEKGMSQEAKLARVLDDVGSGLPPGGGS